MITKEARNFVYLLNVNNNQEKDKLKLGSSLLDLKLALDKLSLLHQ